MRPLHTDDSWIGRQRARASRHGDQNTPQNVQPAPNNHMSFFVADEATLDSYLEQPSISSHPRDSRKNAESSRKDGKEHTRDDAPPSSPFSRASPFSYSPASLTSQTQPLVSRPITPIMLGPSCLGSPGSDSSSRRHSFASSSSGHDMINDQASDGQQPGSNLLSTMTGGGGFPQLIMPSIRMPSRRPFTQTGKNFGRLKILLAGQAGVGKTSLLKAIVQTCDHIVHVDPIFPSRNRATNVSQSDAIAGPSTRESPPTKAIAEVYASTKPYPDWWQELEAPRASHRRKSLGDSVLDRNVCFVDTPGYRYDSTVMEAIMPCVNYIESLFNKVVAGDLSDSDLMGMLGGSGGSQVDVVLYLISHKGLKPADLEYIRRLVPLTNVIPTIAHAELLSETETTACKQAIVRELQKAGIQPFTFTPPGAQEDDMNSKPSIPYTVSSATGSDYDIMDASLLMSSDYVQPLMPTELAFLVEKLFSPDGASWLRHSAAKKFMQWRERTPPGARHLYRPLALAEPYDSSALAPASLALARVSRQGGNGSDTGARLYLVDWAADLQRSQRAERRRYESLLRAEQAAWLTERLKFMQDGTLVAVRRTTDKSMQEERKGRGGRSRTQKHQDPLGLLQLAADFKAIKGWVALEVVGTLGVAGFLVWISQHAWPVEWRR